jgi:hypothetical protein
MPHYLDNRLRDGGKVVSLTHWPLSTPHEHYFTSRKVAGSRPDEMIFFKLPILQTALGPGVHSASNRNEYQKRSISFNIKLILFSPTDFIYVFLIGYSLLTDSGQGVSHDSLIGTRFNAIPGKTAGHSSRSV